MSIMKPLPEKRTVKNMRMTMTTDTAMIMSTSTSIVTAITNTAMSTMDTIMNTGSTITGMGTAAVTRTARCWFSVPTRVFPGTSWLRDSPACSARTSPCWTK